MSQAQVRVHRHADAVDLAYEAARRLLTTIIERQADGHIVQLCLTGGRIASRIYEQMGDLPERDQVDASRLELWWGDERFLPTDDPDRNAGPTFAILAGNFSIDPARTHPMPAADGIADNMASAATYAKELGDTIFDICLLGMGEDGHVASIFPNHPSFEPTSHSVIGVSDAPKPPSERISLSMETLKRSREVWFLVSGEEKADALARAMAGDPTVPAGVARGTERTVWLIDQAAAVHIPYHDCTL